MLVQSNGAPPLMPHLRVYALGTLVEFGEAFHHEELGAPFNRSKTSPLVGSKSITGVGNASGTFSVSTCFSPTFIVLETSTTLPVAATEGIL